MEFPTDFKEKYAELLGDEIGAFLEGLSVAPIKAFRINPLKENFDKVAYSLDEPIPYVPTGFYGEISGKSLEHQTGYVYSQEPSAMYVAEVGDVQPGEIILDLCAAPGGKSTQIATKLAGEGLLVSNEINRKRASILSENIERIGATNVIILNETPQNISANLSGFFDKIFVDAPCSGEGMFRKDPDAIKYWHKDYPKECAIRQREILVETMKMLKPGGQLIYSTCTFAPEEDEKIIQWLLDNYNIELLPVKKHHGMDAGRPNFAGNNSEMEKTVRLFPHHFKGEGHFIAKMQDKRAGLADNVSLRKSKKAKGNSFFRKITKNEEQLWLEFHKNVLKKELFNTKDLKCWGDQLFYYPDVWPDIGKLKFVKPGFQLGVFKKKRFEPAYGLALAIKTSDVQQTIKLDDAQWLKYVSGNVVTLVDSDYRNGWYVLQCHEKNFAFAKLVNGTLKNFFPKGLRFNI